MVERGTLGHVCKQSSSFGENEHRQKEMMSIIKAFG